MAEINVEKAGRNVWPWVIGALAVILLVVALVSLLSNDDPNVEIRQATPEAPPAAGS
jgi:hypothetical protein